MNQRIFFAASILAICISLFSSCKTKKDIVYEGSEDILQEELLDTLVISSATDPDSLPKEYRGSASLPYDILHTKLELSFDMINQFVLGKASLTIKPYFKPLQKVSLDAVGFDIHTVKLLPSGTNLTHKYDGEKLHIDLNSVFLPKETFEVYIDYTAKPNRNVTSGSEAITSDKGLFFINPTGTDKDVPVQIWSQGETENNSKWFPTFDKPNERFTQEMFLTVDNKYLTLSNGKKMSSVKNADGTRTDRWKQDKPHAPYLAMIAIGDFHEDMDMWNNIPLHYVVEKGFAKHAKKIFNHTPEMLKFFSEKLNYPYPWDKYAQVVVRDFVSGAMENTSAVVFGDFIQKTERELIDNDNDYIIAHEMMHHWFGDLVTCEDWSNLTLNEGFANYAEYLWFENKYGRDRAEFHRMNEMNGYFSQVFGQGAHPLIHYYYDDSEQMFDAHSYNKGGLVIHMLRNYLGDEAFFSGLHKYLVDNAYSAVEVDELRMAFEDTIGEDLHWFFDQWFLGNGQPHLDVTYTYNDENRVLLIEVDQSKTPKEFHKLFTLPVDIAIYFEDGSIQYHPVLINEMKQRILIEDLKAKPATYVFDGKNILLALINENKTTEQYKAQFRLSPNFMDKMIAFTSTNDGNEDLIEKAMSDPFYLIRSMGINAIPDSLIGPYINSLQSMTLTDLHSEVRRDALLKLLNQEDFDPTQLCLRILDGEQAYPVLQIALEVIGSLDPEKAAPYIEKFKKDDSDYLAGSLAGIITEEDTASVAYLENKARTIGVASIFEFYARYQEFLVGKDTKTIKRAGEQMYEIASNKDGNMYRKYLATMTIVKLAEEVTRRNEENKISENTKLLESFKMMLSDIVSNETNLTLIEKYSGLK
ncbi:MAG: alanyl aminopeptidase [Saprospiraceae bacterium]|nr:alanyl aminopeptidase [Saprospiraceae bacterium]